MSISNLIAVGVAVLLLWNAYYLFWLCMAHTDNLPEFIKWVNKTLPPRRMYENTKMNKVGCYLCSILLFVALVPLMILYGIYLLFHIGRKDEYKITEDIEYYRGYIIRKNQRKDYTEICKDEQCVDRVLGVSEASIKYTKLKIDKLIKGTENNFEED